MTKFPLNVFTYKSLWAAHQFERICPFLRHFHKNKEIEKKKIILSAYVSTYVKKMSKHFITVIFIIWVLLVWVNIIMSNDEG